MTLRDWRRARRLKGNELAEKLGVTPRTVSRWETGQNVPHASMIRAIKTMTDGEVTADDFHSDQRAA
jgi:transcriptional regulator with XRE-family HTH domain